MQIHKIYYAGTMTEALETILQDPILGLQFNTVDALTSHYSQNINLFPSSRVDLCLCPVLPIGIFPSNSLFVCVYRFPYECCKDVCVRGKTKFHKFLTSAREARLFTLRPPQEVP